MAQDRAPLRLAIRYDRTVHLASWRPPDAARRVTFSPDLAWAAYLDVDDSVELVAPFTDRALRLRIDRPPRALALADDGAALALVDDQRHVRLIVTATPGDARALPLRCGDLSCSRVAPSPWSERVTIAAHDLVLAPGAEVMLVSERSSEDQEEYYGGGWITSEAATRLLHAPTGAAHLLIQESSSHPITYSARDNERMADHPLAAAFSRTGRHLALRTRKGHFAVYTREGTQLAAFDDPTLQAFAFLPDDAGIVTASGARLAIRDLAGPAIRELAAAHPPTALACSPCGARIACLDAAGAVTVLDLATGAAVSTLPPDDTGPPRAIGWPGEHLRILRADDNLCESSAAAPAPG